jgi:hypothetical protein
MIAKGQKNTKESKVRLEKKKKNEECFEYIMAVTTTKFYVL